MNTFIKAGARLPARTSHIHAYARARVHETAISIRKYVYYVVTITISIH